MRAITIIIASLFCVSCIPTTDMIQDGHYWIQITQSRNIWGQNVVHVTRCHVSNKDNGYCAGDDIRQSEQMYTVGGPGPQIASSLLNAAAIVGGAAILMHGLQTQNVSRPAGGLNFNQAQTASTLSSGPVSIFRVP